MKQLIVTADDVGLHPGMTAGAIRAHREGIVTACSVVANGRAFEDAIARLRDVPTLEVGVHLTLVEETPLTDLRVPKKWPSFLPLYFAGAIGDIERELRAQVERVLATGLTVTHLNGHQHLHVLPGIFAIVERIARDHGIRYIRRVDDHGGRAGILRKAAVAALSALGRRARGTNDRTIGVTEAGHLTGIEPLLDHVDGLTELVTHPGLGVDGYAWGYDWDRETAALCDPALREAIARRGIALTAPAAAG